jgi:O-antigen ligase
VLGTIKALIFLLACVALALLVMRLVDREQDMRPHAFAWSAFTVVTFLSQSFYVIIPLLLLFKMVYLKNDVEKNIAAYLVLFTAFPYTYVFPLVQGINLLDFRMQGAMALIFFLPLVFRILVEEEFSVRKIDYAFLIIITIFAVGNFRPTFEFEFTIPQAIRDTFALFTEVFLPYFVISRGIRSRESLYRVMVALVFGGFIVTFFTYVEVLLEWKPHVDLGAGMGILPPMESFYEWRGGFLRASATLTGPITLGFYLTLIMAVLLGILKINRKSVPVRLALLLLVMIPIYWTGSRGALLGAIIMVVAYVVFGMRPQVRRVLFIPLFLVGLVSVFAYETLKPPAEEHVSFKQVDTHGTFEYRAKLLETSLQVIPEHLWLGTRLYKQDQRMQKLVQGMGIIDMVNGYVHLAIEWGLICLLVFLYIVFRGYFQLARNISTEDDEDFIDTDEEGLPPRYDVTRAFSQALAAILISLCMQFAFTSYSSTIILVIWLTLALIRAMRNITYLEEVAQEEDAGEAVSHA